MNIFRKFNEIKLSESEQEIVNLILKDPMHLQKCRCMILPVNAMYPGLLSIGFATSWRYPAFPI